MNKKSIGLEVEIPWWYKPFICFMPNFYDEVPTNKQGTFEIRVDKLKNSFVSPIAYGASYGGYPSIHSVYLKVRWKALWIDFWTTGSDEGIQWVIKRVS